MPLADAFDGFNLVRLASQGDHAAETGGAVCACLKRIEQFAVVGLVVAVNPGIAGGVYTRRAVEGVDFQSGIVGQRRESACSAQAGGLLDRVAGKAVAVLDDLGQAGDVGESRELKAVDPEYRLYLPDLVFVAGGQQQFHSCLLYLLRGELRPPGIRHRLRDIPSAA